MVVWMGQTRSLKRSVDGQREVSMGKEKCRWASVDGQRDKLYLSFSLTIRYHKVHGSMCQTIGVLYEECS